MPPTGPQKPPLPSHWKKYHLDIYRDMQSVKNAGEILKALVKYQQLKNDGVANPPQELVDAHIEVARHILEKEKGITVDEIAKSIGANFKTISQHTRYLVQAGLIQKQYRGNRVAHALSPYGKIFTRFIKEFQRIGPLAPK